MAYSSTNTYAVLDDLKMRLTDNGYKNLADRDTDGFVGTRDQNIIEEAIENANQIIDGYLQAHIDPDDARGESNVWLRDRCVDLAAYIACSLGGRTIPETFVAVRDDAMQMLRDVSRGRMHVPRLQYPYNPGAGSQTQRVPRAYNPGRRSNRRR